MGIQTPTWTMHTSSMKRMEWFAKCFLQGSQKLNVLDVGSYNVNGCYKEFFDTARFEYVGLDMEAGPNVDIVPSSPYQWKELNDDKFDVVISGQALEHIEFFWVSIAEMVRVTKEGGLICIIAPNGFGEHRYPVDCWRFFTDGMVALARYNQLEILHTHTNAAPSINESEWFSSDCADSMLIAKKPYAGGAKIIDLANYKCIPADQQKLRGQMITFGEYQETLENPSKKTQDHSQTESIVNEDKASTYRKGQVRSAMQLLIAKIKRKLKDIKREINSSNS